MKKNVVYAILSNFGFLSFFSIFESLAASENEQVAQYQEKTLFLVILSDFRKPGHFRC